MILVTGATGRVGFRLLEQLADAQAPATAMVRVEAKAEDLPTGVGHVVATLDAPPPAEVLQTFERVFLLSPVHEGQAELEVSFVDALVAAGHGPHVVKVAVDGFQEPDCEVRFMRNHRLIAAHLDATGLPVTYLAPNSFMENLLSSADTIRDQGTIFAPAGDGRIGFVAAGDVAAVAARALTGIGEQDGIHVITGPEALSYTDVADRISAVFARQVGYEDVPPGRARETMLADGLPAWQVDGVIELFEWIRNGGCDTVTDEVRQTTGADARPIEDWLSEMRGVFLGPRDGSPPRF
jgi:NAD(P)H dehydrogenase (quinone)